MAQPSNALALSPKDLVVRRLPAILEALPTKRETALKRFRQAALGVCNNPSISRCDPSSVYSAVYTCARLNLIPDPVLKQVYVIPFRNKATVILGYNGIIDLARRAVPGLELTTGVVYDNDDYTLTEGLEPRFAIFKRHWQKGQEPGGLVFSYCIWRLPGQERATVTIVPLHKLDALAKAAKAKSYSGKDTPWQTDFDAMSEKTAIRRASKLWTLSPERAEDAERFREAVDLDESDEQPQVEVETGVLDALEAPPGEHRIGQLRPKPTPQPRPQQQSEEEIKAAGDAGEDYSYSDLADAPQGELESEPTVDNGGLATAEAALDAAAVPPSDEEIPSNPFADAINEGLRQRRKAQSQSQPQSVEEKYTGGKQQRLIAPAPPSPAEREAIRRTWAKIWSQIDAKIKSATGSVPTQPQPLRDRLLELVAPGGPPEWDKLTPALLNTVLIRLPQIRLDDVKRAVEELEIPPTV